MVTMDCDSRGARVRRKLAVHGIVTIAACVAVAVTSGKVDAEESREVRVESARLVEQLGDPAFVQRERASRQLAELGVDAREALLQAAQSNDEEVRHRARALLLRILEDDLNARISQFAIDGEENSGVDLPGWTAFRDLVSETPDNRRLFVEIIRAEPLLMEALEAGPEQATEALRARTSAMQQEMQNPHFFNNAQTPHRVPLGTVAAFFLAASDEKVGVDENVGRVVQSILYQSSFQVDINSGPRSAALRRMLGRWIVRNRTSTMAYQGLHFAMQYNLPEGRELAQHLVRGGGQPANLLQTALLVLGRFGNQEDVELIQPMLKDESPVHFGANPNGFQQEVRDIALAVSIHLSGQELREFGFNNAQANPQMLYNPGTLTFSSPAMREAAFKKWEAWRAKEQSQAPANG